MNTLSQKPIRPSSVPPPLLLIDGVCNLCNGAVQFLIRRDKRKIFRYASLQSATGKKIAEQLCLKISAPPETMILILNSQAYFKSTAWLEILNLLGGAWKALLIFKILPAGFRDFFYDLIAKNRYRWFGKKDSCPIPSPETKYLFVD